MKKVAMGIHGGASTNSVFLRKNKKEIEQGLVIAVEHGYKILKKGGTSLQAVEEAVMLLEDNPMFNAGKGSTLNCNGEIEMDASIMNGKNLKAGAVAMVRNVKNPVSLARVVMTKTNHVFLSGYGALEIAHNQGIIIEPDSYFITRHQYAAYAKLHRKETSREIMEKRFYGTVGAVALDKKGNVAAATSTGGMSNCLPARIGDSCIIGGGCYANNQSCAISGTGDGEYLITGVIAHTIAMYVELKKMTLQEACDFVIHTRNKTNKAGIGVIGVTPQGDIGVSYNTSVMKRASINVNGILDVQL